jgi:alanyl-tRNA synthetase
MMTAAQIRQSFLDFFKSKQHTIVPSSSLMPDSPNLLFTNAGMNQFVPIFLGQVECPYKPGRAADTQKCIRAGGKHNDLDDVGLDTYHHTFFEMLGNWSFGDYFKKEAIAWAWELIIEVWKFPAERVYATIYQPGPGDPSERDQEAWDIWAEKFRSAGLDPDIHIVNGNKKDNFWMMGETGPCGPCTEIHVDLTPGPMRTSVEQQKAGAALVNGPTPAVIEIWNNVFIQYNANPDGTFTPLPAQHVDTGMGFERVVSIIHGTKDFTDFENAKISNYDTDVFRPLFDEIEKLSGKKYTSTLPAPGSTGETEQEKVDVAFRVIADHIRTLSFSIADGIVPGNEGRHHVLRTVLRRAVRYYYQVLEQEEPFLCRLVPVLSSHMGAVFPEILSRRDQIIETIRREEELALKTMVDGMERFYDYLLQAGIVESNPIWQRKTARVHAAPHKPGFHMTVVPYVRRRIDPHELQGLKDRVLVGSLAFRLHDEGGLVREITELMAKEHGIRFDAEGFDTLMAEQKQRAKEAQKKQIISALEFTTDHETRFVGYEELTVTATILMDRTSFLQGGEVHLLIPDRSPFYREMGGQLADMGYVAIDGDVFEVLHVGSVGKAAAIAIKPSIDQAAKWTAKRFAGQQITAVLSVDAKRRAAISRHHSVTHLLHWALHEVVSRDATQKGSYVGPEKLTFDFNSAALTPQQIADVERLVNERILENAPVTWQNVKYSHIKERADIMQAFGEKYGDWVRVVQIGGHATGLDGYSMELCGGTHVRGTGEIGLFRIAGEAATGAGIRRIEAVAGLSAYEQAIADAARLKNLAAKLGSPLPDLEKKLELLVEHAKSLEKTLKAAQQREASGRAKELLATAGNNAIVANLGDVDADYAMAVSDALKGAFKGIVVLGTHGGGNVALIATVSPDFQSKVQAGKIISAIAPIVAGKGGGKPDFARGGGKDVAKLDAALAEARKLIPA